MLLAVFSQLQMALEKHKTAEAMEAHKVIASYFSSDTESDQDINKFHAAIRLGMELLIADDLKKGHEHENTSQILPKTMADIQTALKNSGSRKAMEAHSRISSAFKDGMWGNQDAEQLVADLQFGLALLNTNDMQPAGSSEIRHRTFAPGM